MHSRSHTAHSTADHDHACTCKDACACKDVLCLAQASFTRHARGKEGGREVGVIKDSSDQGQGPQAQNIFPEKPFSQFELRWLPQPTRWLRNQSTMANSSAVNAMLRAAETGDVAALKTAFDDGVDVMAKDAAKNTAVHTNPAFSATSVAASQPLCLASCHRSGRAAQPCSALRDAVLSLSSPRAALSVHASSHSASPSPSLPPFPSCVADAWTCVFVCGVHALACACLHACADFGPGSIQTHWQHAYVHANIDTNRAASIHSNTYTRTYIHTYVLTYIHR